MNKHTEGLLSGFGAAVALAYFAWCLSTGIKNDQEYLEANDARVEAKIAALEGQAR